MGILLKEHFNRWYSLKSYYISVTLLDLPISVINEFIYFLCVRAWFVCVVCALYQFPFHLIFQQRKKWNRFSFTKFTYLPIFFVDYIYRSEIHCVCVWVRGLFNTKCEHLAWLIFIWFSVSRHNDLFRFNLHHNESTAWIIPLWYVPCDMRCGDNCWPEYWSHGWCLVRCGGKWTVWMQYDRSTACWFGFHLHQFQFQSRILEIDFDCFSCVRLFCVLLCFLLFPFEEWYILSANTYHTNDDVCRIWCHIAWLAQLYEMG